MTTQRRPRPAPARQVDPAEHAYADELAFLAAYDDGPRPPGWRLTPRAVVTFIVGSAGQELSLANGSPPRRAARASSPIGASSSATGRWSSGAW